MSKEFQECYKFDRLRDNGTLVRRRSVVGGNEFPDATVLYDPPNDTPIWDSVIDATYVVFLEGNDLRYQQVINQLNEVNTTKNTWILHNTSYKTCKKADHVNSSAKDIVDANLAIFKHAQEQGYESILILEDDFLFDARMIDSPQDTKEIQHFVNDYPKDRPLLYYLGTLPLIQCPVGLDHNMVILTCGSHGVIYNLAFRQMILGLSPDVIDDWDIYMTRYNGWRYTYKQPLCYQLYPYTPNSTHWGGDSWIVQWLGSQFHDFNTVVLGLDRTIEPGYSFYNMVSKLLFFILLLCVVFLVWSILQIIVSQIPIFRLDR